MQNDLTAEQAAKITDLESYKTVTGAKRFKRTKEEMSSGLSPDEALHARIKDALTGASIVPDIVKRSLAQVKAGKLNNGPKSLQNGTITILVRPASGTDADYFEHVPTKPIEIILDEQWYTWYDTLAKAPFEGDIAKLLQYVLDQGIGAVLTKFHFPSDIK